MLTAIIIGAVVVLTAAFLWIYVSDVAEKDHNFAKEIAKIAPHSSALVIYTRRLFRRAIAHVYLPGYEGDRSGGENHRKWLSDHRRNGGFYIRRWREFDPRGDKALIMAMFDHREPPTQPCIDTSFLNLLWSAQRFGNQFGPTVADESMSPAPTEPDDQAAAATPHDHEATVSVVVGDAEMAAKTTHEGGANGRRYQTAAYESPSKPPADERRTFLGIGPRRRG